jgi:hypothetical protein
MNNIHISILGSNSFLEILNELEFNNIINPKSKPILDIKEVLVKILFVENLKIKDVKNFLLQNEPTILFLQNKDYIKSNNLNFII